MALPTDSAATLNQTGVYPRRTFLARLASRKTLVAILLAATTLAIAVGVSLVRWPVPGIHDEFSYLLAADTFANGRCTNPTHPFWEHFETMHVLHQPTYASKYPPGQGLIMALGQIVTGHSIAGVWFSSALAIVGCYWMLLGWVSPRWAAVGALLLVTHRGFQLLWGQSYWGGTVAFLGGALVFGALPRLLKETSVREAVIMASGAVLLGISRPYEGLVLCGTAWGMLMMKLLRREHERWRHCLWRVLLPQAAVLVAGGVLLSYYHWRVTESPFVLPYSVHEAEYAQSPNFIWQRAQEDRTYRHEVIERFHNEWAMSWYRAQRSLLGFVQTKVVFAEAALLFCPLFTTLPLLLLPWWRGRRVVAVVYVIAICCVASIVTIWSWPHYMAPMAPLLVIVTVWGLRNLRVLGWRRLRLTQLAGSLVLLHVGMFAWDVHVFCTAPRSDWRWQRSKVSEQLDTVEGTHLVFVRYTPEHNTCKEWVYNLADIDSAKVVWAREISPSRDRALIDYFSERRVWLVEADTPEPKLREYAARSDAAL